MIRHDYVIVGGGVYGAGLAWELARRNADVLLLEAGEVAGGASGGPGKRGVRANGRDIRELALMKMAYEIWPKLADDIEGPTGYERIGGLILGEKEASGTCGGHGSLEARRWSQARAGIPTRILDRNETRDLEPLISKDVAWALYCPEDGVADHTSTTLSLARAARRAGAEIRENARVDGVEIEGDKVSAVTTADEEHVDVGRMLFLLSNTHAAGFVGQHFGVALPVWHVLLQVVITEPLDEVPARHLVGHDERPLSMKEIDGRRMMLSGGWRGHWNVEKNRSETVTENVIGNLQEAVAVYPSLSDARPETSDASRPESCCVDQIPVIDRIPSVSNAIVGTGWSGHGFAIAPAVSRLLAEWAIRGNKPALLRPFSYGRFK